MAIFYPSNPKPSIPLEVEQQWRTLISITETGREFRRRKWIKPRRRIKIKYDRRYKNELDTIWQFYVDRKGTYEEFLFVFPYEENWQNEFVAKGSEYWSYNNQVRYYVPVKEPTSITIIVDGKTFYPLKSDNWNQLFNISLSWSSALNTSKLWAYYLSWDGLTHPYYFIYYTNSTDRDFIVFYNYTPSPTSTIYCNFIGKPCLRMRFEEDNLNKQVAEVLLTTIGLTLIEIK